MKFKLLLTCISVLICCGQIIAEEQSSSISVSSSLASSSDYSAVQEVSDSDSPVAEAEEIADDELAADELADDELEAEDEAAVELEAGEAEVAEPMIEKTEEQESISTQSAKREVLGWMERISLLPEKAFLDSKLTPGSEGNVLHAKDIKRFKRGGKSWVRFTTLNRKGESIEIERELIEGARFRTTSGAIEKRLKIKSGICLSGKYMELEFALSDRSEFEHEVRIGRDALAGHFLVDPGRTKATKPHCKARGLGLDVDS